MLNWYWIFSVKNSLKHYAQMGKKIRLQRKSSRVNGAIVTASLTGFSMHD